MSEFKPQYKARVENGRLVIHEIKVLSAPNKRGEIRCERHSACGFLAMVPQDWLSKSPEHAKEVFIHAAENQIVHAEQELQRRRDILKVALA